MPDLNVMQMNIEEAWEVFKMLVRDMEEFDEESYKKARFGIRIKFDINEYTNKWIRVKTKKGIVLIRGKVYRSEDFWTEIEEREYLIKRWIIENIEDEEMAKSYRGNINGD